MQSGMLLLGTHVQVAHVDMPIALIGYLRLRVRPLIGFLYVRFPLRPAGVESSQPAPCFFCWSYSLQTVGGLHLASAIHGAPAKDHVPI